MKEHGKLSATTCLLLISIRIVLTVIGSNWVRRAKLSSNFTDQHINSFSHLQDSPTCAFFARIQQIVALMALHCPQNEMCVNSSLFVFPRVYYVITIICCVFVCAKYFIAHTHHSFSLSLFLISFIHTHTHTHGQHCVCVCV